MQLHVGRGRGSGRRSQDVGRRVRCLLVVLSDAEASRLSEAEAPTPSDVAASVLSDAEASVL
jgi:hypothetical protein